MIIYLENCLSQYILDITHNAMTDRHMIQRPL